MTNDKLLKQLIIKEDYQRTRIDGVSAAKLAHQTAAITNDTGHYLITLDVFHQLHCLERIRGEIISAKYLYQLNPNRTEEDAFTKHTLHCIDYLRQALICHADMTLVSTGKDLEFDHAPPRQCRDFDAVLGWVMDRRYDYNKWLNGIDSEAERT